MTLRKSLQFRPIIAILAVTMMVVALACAGEDAAPTSPPTATAPAPTATSPAAAGATATAVPEATATAVPVVDLESLPWIERYMRSPGYNPAWGTPKTGGILKMGMPKNPDNLGYHVTTTTPGPHAMLPFNALIRFDPWVGGSAIIGDLANSWEFAPDARSLTVKWPKGIKFHDNPNIPAEYKGGKIRGEEFVCEDAQASVEFFVRPPATEPGMPLGPTILEHLSSVSCPDGPQGYTAVMNFDKVLGKTMNSFSEGHMVMLDKDYIEWMTKEKPDFRKANSPEKFLWLAGYGPFVPLEFQPDVITKHRRNPNYYREGLPFVDGVDLFIIKDHTTRFTALATGQIHYFGHGSYGMLPGQVAQAQRDFKKQIVVNAAQHVFSYGVQFNMARPPFADQRVRKAMHLAFDRDDYLLFRRAGTYPGSLLMGFLVPGTYFSPTEAELRTWPGIRQPKDQDIAEANRLLDEVFGKGNRFKTSCQTTVVQNEIDLCLFLIDQMKKHLNIDMTMEVLANVVKSQYADQGQYDISEGSVGFTKTGDPDDYLLGNMHRDYVSKNASTQLKWQGWTAAVGALQDELEALIEAQSVEIDPVKRRQLVIDIEYKLTQEAIYIIHFGWNMGLFGTHVSLKGYKNVPFSGNLIWGTWERVWIAK